MEPDGNCSGLQSNFPRLKGKSHVPAKQEMPGPRVPLASDDDFMGTARSQQACRSCGI